ncbi:MAG: hypothetical protein JNM00_08915 [Flavobacteriales bacterium]|nr:hypothetical protein [Flavobacteriales bacterium]
MTELMLWLIWSPPVVAIMCIVILAIKPDSTRDKFFALHSDLSGEALLERIEILENEQLTELKDTREYLDAAFRDGILEDKEIEVLQELMIDSFYYQYKRPGIIYLKTEKVSLIALILFCAGMPAQLVLLFGTQACSSEKTANFNTLLRLVSLSGPS